jgi:hypothetical protein
VDNIKLGAMSLALGAVIGFFICRQYSPRIETVDKVVEKEVVRNNVVTVTKTVTIPNGSTETTTIVTDRSVKAESKTDESHKTEIVVKDWRIGLYTDSKELNHIKASLDRRILGNLSLGVLAGADSIKIGLTWDF